MVQQASDTCVRTGGPATAAAAACCPSQRSGIAGRFEPSCASSTSKPNCRVQGARQVASRLGPLSSPNRQGHTSAAACHTPAASAQQCKEKRRGGVARNKLVHTHTHARPARHTGAAGWVKMIHCAVRPSVCGQRQSLVQAHARVRSTRHLGWVCSTTPSCSRTYFQTILWKTMVKRLNTNTCQEHS